MGDRVACRTQPFDQSAKLAECGFERIQIGKLAADMQGHTAQPQTVQRRQAREDPLRLADGDTELVVRLAGRNLVVRAGIDIRIDPQGAARLDPALRSQRRQFHAFFFAFDIELADPGFQPVGHLARGLADAGKHDLVCRHVGGQRAPHFAAGYHVRTIALALQDLEH